MNRDDAVPFDLAVLGAGPAGAACALTAARAGLRVALFEPQGAVFDKPCGEGLMPFGVDALRELELDDVASRARPFHTVRYVCRPSQPLDLDLPAPGIATTRPELMAGFERALQREPSVARVSERARARRVDSGHSIETASGTAVLSRTLVVATGCTGPRRIGRLRLGVRARFHAARNLDRVEVHLSRGCEAYLTPLPHGLVNVALLVDGEPARVRGARAWLEWGLSRHPRAAEALGALVDVPEARILDRRAPRDVATDEGFRIGDAAGAVDPILGCGVSLALWSGILAGRAVAEIVRGRSLESAREPYRRAWRRLSNGRRRFARALRVLGAHPAAARVALEVLRRSSGLRARLTDLASSESLPTTYPRTREPQLLPGASTLHERVRGRSS